MAVSDPDVKSTTFAEPETTFRVEQNQHTPVFDRNRAAYNEPRDQHTANPNSHILRRCRPATIVTLIVTTITALVAIIFIAFLWHSNTNNSTWHTIVATQWLTRAITISTFALRSSIDIQIGIAAAMVAAVLLETGHPLLRYAPQLSTARASKPRPRTLVLPVLRSTRRHMSTPQVITAMALIVLCCTTLLIQFSSTFLLSDLTLGAIPGLVYKSLTKYDFEYPVKEILYRDKSGWSYYQSSFKYYHVQSRVTTWRRNPPAYPAFAEYSEPAPISNGVDDTGMLLRAFLPFADADSRQSLKEYSGKAFVLDSRVSCQPPKLENLYSKGMKPNNQGYKKRDIYTEDFEVTFLEGTYGPSRHAERLWAPAKKPPFRCYIALATNVTTICQVQGAQTSTNGLDWHWSLGNRGGGLISEFSNITLKDIDGMLDENPKVAAFFTWGTAMLVFQALQWDSYHWRAGLNYSSASDTSLRYYERGPWLDIFQTGPGAGIRSNISVSLCYAAWDTAKAAVNMYSDSNRTEPVAYWDLDRRFYTMPSAVDQLGNNRSSLNSASRGILDLEKKASWVRTPQDADPIQYMPYVQQFGDAGSYGLDLGPTVMTANWTVFLSSSPKDLPYMDHTKHNPAVWADPNLVSLFNQFMEKGSLASSISSLITILSSMAYYDEIPRFQAKTNATQLFFSTVLLPTSNQGFWVVMSLVALHAALICGFAIAFLTSTQFTSIGDHWMSISQLWGPISSDLILSSSRKTDRDLRAELGASGRDNVTVRVNHLGHEDLIGLSRKQKESKEAHND